MYTRLTKRGRAVRNTLLIIVAAIALPGIMIGSIVAMVALAPTRSYVRPTASEAPAIGAVQNPQPSEVIPPPVDKWVDVPPATGDEWSETIELHSKYYMTKYYPSAPMWIDPCDGRSPIIINPASMRKPGDPAPDLGYIEKIRIKAKDSSTRERVRLVQLRS